MVSAVTNPRISFPERLEVQKSLSSRDVKVQHIARGALDQFRSAWSYIGKLLLITKHVLKIILKSCKNALSCQSRASEIKPILTRMKLFSFASIPLNTETVIKESYKLSESAKLEDYEGSALSAASILLLMGDTIDSTATFVEGVLELASFPAIEWVGNLGLPLGFSLSAGGILTRSYGIWKIQKFQSDFVSDPLLNQPITEESKAAVENLLREKLQTHLGLSPDEIKKIEKKSLFKKDPLGFQLRMIEKLERKKELSLKRATSAKLVAQMKELKGLLAKDTLTAHQAKSAIHLVSNVKTSAFRNTLLKVAGIAANAITLVGLTLFFFSVAPYVPFIFLLGAMVIRLGMVIYEDAYKGKGLLEVDFSPKVPILNLQDLQSRRAE